MQKLKALIEQFAPADTKEHELQRKFLFHMERYPRSLYRDEWAGHFTASLLLFDYQKERFLFTHHRKLKKWVQLGGHADGEEDLLLVAQKEATEESGITNIVPLANIPIHLDIHEIPSYRNEPAHLHFDARFIFHVSDPIAQIVVSEESLDLQWVSPKEAKELTQEASILALIEKGTLALNKDCGLTLL